MESNSLTKKRKSPRSLSPHPSLNKNRVQHEPQSSKSPKTQNTRKSQKRSSSPFKPPSNSNEPHSEPCDGTGIKYSLLDLRYLWATNSPNRGFISVFWVFMFFQFAMRVWERCCRGETIMGWTIGKVFFRDGFGFWVIELLLVGTCYLALVLHWLGWAWWMPRVGYWSYRVNLECAMLLIPSSLMMHRGWHPMQRGAFLLHSMAMLMKMHSFLSVTNDAHKDQRHLVTFRQFTEYLAMPTLIFEYDPPRIKAIRWNYVLEKAAGAIASGAMLYLLVEHSLYPHLSSYTPTTLADDILNTLRSNNPLSDITSQLPLFPSSEEAMKKAITWLDVCIRIFPPFLASCILLFFLVFECCLNLLAEISRYADREFYLDYWNSISWDEWSRKWNIPVHRFLLKHVYLESISTLGLSKWQSAMLTFLISSLLHELVFLVMLGHGPYGYIFIMQMMQIPLIWIRKGAEKVPGSFTARIPPVIWNMAFWACLTMGPTLIAVGYVKEHVQDMVSEIKDE